MRQKNSFLLLLSLSLTFAASASAQTNTTPSPSGQPGAATQTPSPEHPPRRPIRRVSSTPARVTVIPSESQAAPQVVTIVHRLSGVKLLRLLSRQAGANGVIEDIDPRALMSDAHASIIAGWAMDDGKTIAARLPQAAAEIDASQFKMRLPQPPAAERAAALSFAQRVEPDLTVITVDGKKFRGRLIGLDAETGLSVLQINGELVTPIAAVSPANLGLGQAVQIFAPTPVTPEGEAESGNTVVRLEKLNATVATVVRSNSGELQKFIVHSGKLSPNLIGGVACNAAGATIGIVESIEGNNATVASADFIRAATQRVLARQSSVPRPLLGVRGEPVDLAARATLLARGWTDDQALRELINAQVGILLTTVVPQTPAAVANLKPGDVIVRVNQNEVRTAEDFSRFLTQAGSGEKIELTIKRPDTPTPVSVPVTLGGSFAPVFEWDFDFPPATMPFGFDQLGMQTMALTPRVASQMGAQNGLIVIAVQPDGPAARAGMREGDVIESIDGRVVRGAFGTFTLAFPQQKKHTLAVVRDREKKQIILETND